MEQNHFHTNINSGYDHAPYKRHINAEVDPRGRFHTDSLYQQEKIHATKQHINLPPQQHQLPPLHSTSNTTSSSNETTAEENQRKFDSQDSSLVCTNTESKLL